MFAKRLVKSLCAALMCCSLLLGMLLAIAVNTGMFDDMLNNNRGGHFVPTDMQRPDNMDLEDYMNNGGDSGDDDNSKIVLTVKSERHEDTLYLKMQSFGDYLGNGFDPNVKAYEGLINNVYSAHYLQSYTTNNTDKYKLEITPDADSPLPTRVIPYYVRDEVDTEVQNNDLIAVGNDSTMYAIYYNSDALKPKGSIDDPAVAEFELAYREHAKNTYLNVDEETYNALKGIVDGLNLQDKSTSEAIEIITQYVKDSNSYNLQYNKNLDKEENRAVAFLTLNKYSEGVCRHFAEAATLLFRIYGIPARYTEGMYVENLDASTPKTLTTSSFHAWVELYIDGVGWQYVDVTPPMPVNGSEGKELLTVESNHNGSVYLKQYSFGNYDYTTNTWSAATPFSELLYNKWSADYLYGMLSTSTDKKTYKLKVDSVAKDTYVMPYYLVGNIGGDDLFAQDDDTKAKGNNSYEMYYGQGLGITDDAELLAFESEYRNYVYQNYTYVGDEYTASYLQKIIDDNNWVLPNAEDTEAYINFIDDIAAYVNDLAVNSLDNKALNSESNVVVAFLDTYKAGDATHFASATTLLLRQMGVAARYTEGFYASNLKANTPTKLGEGNRDAWVEVYIPSLGWKYIDSANDAIKVTFAPQGYREWIEEDDGIAEVPLDHPLNVSYGYNESSEKLLAKQRFEENYYIYSHEVSGKRAELGKDKSQILAIEIRRIDNDAIVYKAESVYNEESKKYDLNIVQNTGELQVTLSSGTVQLYVDELGFTSKNASVTYVYDGQSHSFDETQVLPYGGTTVDEGYTYVVTPLPNASRTNVGTNAALFTVRIYNEAGEDCTDHFWISTYEYGTVTIDPCKVIITSRDKDAEFDTVNFTPLTDKGTYKITVGEFGYDFFKEVEGQSGVFEQIIDADIPLDVQFTEGALLEGHAIIVKLDGEVTIPGSAPNLILSNGVEGSTHIIDIASGDTVFDNYEIITVSGTLTMHMPGAMA